MPSIETIDPNFKPIKITAEDVEFYDCLSEPFQIHGLHEPRKNGRFMRLPHFFSENEEVLPSIHHLMFDTAGGRVRFITDSPYIAIRATLPYVALMPHMPATGIHAFDMYAAPADDRTAIKYRKTFVPNGISDENPEFEGFYEFDKSAMREITINFPLYGHVDRLWIGLKKGSRMEAPKPYEVEKPVVFYGSSITQGGCASRPGTCYPAYLSRWLDSDYINLGFSGSDRGERVLAEYIAGLSMSAFVLAYGANAPGVKHFEDTYYPFYKTVREKNPDLPILMMGMPSALGLKNTKQKKTQTGKRAVIMRAYLKALESGDENVYFMDGFSLLGGLEAEEATVDSIPPTDLGFYNIAKMVYPVLENMLKPRT